MYELCTYYSKRRRIKPFFRLFTIFQWIMFACQRSERTLYYTSIQELILPLFLHTSHPPPPISPFSVALSLLFIIQDTHCENIYYNKIYNNNVHDTYVCMVGMDIYEYIFIHIYIIHYTIQCIPIIIENLIFRGFEWELYSHFFTIKARPSP